MATKTVDHLALTRQTRCLPLADEQTGSIRLSPSSLCVIGRSSWTNWRRFGALEGCAVALPESRALQQSPAGRISAAQPRHWPRLTAMYETALSQNSSQENCQASAELGKWPRKLSRQYSIVPRLTRSSHAGDRTCFPACRLTFNTARSSGCPGEEIKYRLFIWSRGLELDGTGTSNTKGASHSKSVDRKRSGPGNSRRPQPNWEQSVSKSRSQGRDARLTGRALPGSRSDRGNSRRSSPWGRGPSKQFVERTRVLARGSGGKFRFAFWGGEHQPPRRSVRHPPATISPRTPTSETST